MSVPTAEELVKWGKENGFLKAKGNQSRLSDGLLEKLRIYLGPDGWTIRIGKVNMSILNAVQAFKPGMSDEETVKALNLTQAFLEMMRSV